MVKRAGFVLVGLLACGCAFAAPASRPPLTSVSHLAVYAADAAKTERFYVHDLGAVKMPDPENPAGVRYYFSPIQFVEVLPLPANAGLNRMDHMAFNTANVEAMRRYLASKKIAVPAKVSTGGDGSKWIEVKDPEGNRVQFVQAVPAAVPVDPLFGHIIHVGAVVHDRALEDTFYRDILGFRPYWFGGMKDDAPPQWVSQQVPYGTDWLEYMVTSNTLTQAQMGVLNHIALGVPNMEATYTKLWIDDRLQGQAPTTTPKIGRDAKWQLNLIDPDGTRAEVMELHAIGKPCCSAFTAADPEKVMRRLFGILLGLMLASGVAMAKPIKVMILDGASAAAYHNWKLGTQILKRELDETGLFDVTVVTVPPSDGDFSNVHPDFAKYQVVVLNYDSQDWPAALKTEFEAYMKDGGGLVSVHGADNAFPGWAAFNEMTGIGGWRGRDAPAGPRWFYDNGKLESDASPGPAGLHGKRKPFRITARAPQHPIMRGLPAEWMTATDELYTRLRGPGRNMTVLATAYADPANRGTGHDEPMLMAVTWGKGRIFHTTLGHDATALSCVGFMTTFQRGTEWAATGKVTQKVPKTFPTANTVSYRADLAAMDPDVADGTLTTLPKPK